MTVRAQVILPGLSGKPEDVFVNTFHFDSAATDAATVDLLTGRITEFYNQSAPMPTPSGNAAPGIASYISHVVSRLANACSVRFYNLADAEPRAYVERRWQLAGSSGTGTSKELPTEVACCTSFYGTRNMPRQRGRLYIGPFHEGAIEDDATFQRSRPALGLRESIHGSSKRLAMKVGNKWAVFSPTSGLTHPVTAGWVDDAWDTQRRRGQDAEGRLSWTDVV